MRSPYLWCFLDFERVFESIPNSWGREWGVWVVAGGRHVVVMGSQDTRWHSRTFLCTEEGSSQSQADPGSSPINQEADQGSRAVK